MPKASFAPKDFYTPTGGFTEGNFEIKEAAVVIFQYPADRQTGAQLAPMTAAKLVLQKLDERGKATDDEPFEKMLRIDGDTSRVRPGNAKSRDDQEPEDLGDELGTEGNCAYVEDGVQLNANSIFATFMKSVEDQGFKPGILSEGLMDDLVGLSAHGITKKSEKRNIKGREVETNYFMVDKILARPGEKGGKKLAAVESTQQKKANGAAKAVSNSEDADAAATAILAELSAELDGESRESKKVFAMAYSRLVRDKDRNKKLDKEIQDLLHSDEWLGAKAEDIGYEYANGVFRFGAAA